MSHALLSYDPYESCVSLSAHGTQLRDERAAWQITLQMC